MEVGGIGRFEAYLLARQTLHGLDIGIDLEVEAAFQLGTLAGELLRVERDVLVACGAGGYAHKVRHPARAAQRTAAGADAAYAAGFLARTDLFHLDAYLECLGKDFDKLTEVYTLVGDVIEYGLVAVALVLYVANLHVQPQALGNLAGAYHGIVLTRLGLFVFLDVDRLGEAEYALGVGSITAGGTFHAKLGQGPGEGDGAYIMPRGGLDSNEVAWTERQVGGIAEISLAGILELHFHNVACRLVAGYVGKPVEAVKLATAAVAAARACSRFRVGLGLLGIVRGLRRCLSGLPAVGIVARGLRGSSRAGRFGILSHGLTWQSLPNESRG